MLMVNILCTHDLLFQEKSSRYCCIRQKSNGGLCIVINFKHCFALCMIPGLHRMDIISVSGWLLASEVVVRSFSK